MSKLQDVLELRVRYSETDQMGTFYNSRALEWFECARTELMRRKLGLPYTAIEERGVFLPLVEIASAVEFSGRARLRFDVHITQNTTAKAVVRGWTIHAFADAGGKPIRPPAWFIEAMQRASAKPEARV
jgi:acyl-CoA thioester hydrolase